MSALTNTMVSNKKTQSKRALKKKAMLLEKFNSLMSYNILKLENMIVGAKYRICNAQRVNSNMGSRILFQLEKNEGVFLPEIYNCLSEAEMSEMGSSKYSLINRGKTENAFHLELEACPQDGPLEQEKEESPISPMMNSSWITDNNPVEYNDAVTYFCNAHF